jgi:type I restriction enzyme S subunit
MKIATLGEICELKYGRSLPASMRAHGHVPVLGSNGRVGTHSEAITNAPAIVVGRKGSIGEVRYSVEACWPIDTTYYIDASSTSEHLRWLYYALIGLRLTDLNKATGVPGLNRNDAYEKKLRVPSVPVQRRIAAILDKADDIRRKHNGATELAHDFLRSCYIHLVGYRNPEFGNWRSYKIENLAASHKGAMRTGPFGSDLRHSEFVDQGIAVLGIDNAVKNHFDWDERRYISEEKYSKLRRYRVFPKDVIITIMGTTGRSAVVPDDISEAITTKHLATITCDQTKVVPEFLSFAIHSDPLLIRQIQRANKGAIMAGLNLGIIKALEIKLPPLRFQEKFSRILSTISAVKDEFLAPETNGVDLFESLSQRASRGEL